MKYYINVIEQYNNFMQLDASEDINFIKQKIENLTNIKDSKLLIEEFKYCAKIVNIYYNEIDTIFKKEMLKQERKFRQYEVYQKF